MAIGPSPHPQFPFEVVCENLPFLSQIMNRWLPVVEDTETIFCQLFGWHELSLIWSSHVLNPKLLVLLCETAIQTMALCIYINIRLYVSLYLWYSTSTLGTWNGHWSRSLSTVMQFRIWTPNLLAPETILPPRLHCRQRRRAWFFEGPRTRHPLVVRGA